MTDFDPNKSYCDWSINSMQLNVSSNLIFSFLNRLNYDLICSRLVGKIDYFEILKFIMDPYN